MPSIGPFLLMLGLVLSSARAQVPSVETKQTSQTPSLADTGNNVTTDTTNTTVPFTESSLVPARSPDANSTVSSSSSPRTMSASPEPITPFSTAVTTKKPVPMPATAKPTTESSSEGRTATILIIVILLAVLLLCGACIFTRKRSRKFSVDLHSRQDDTQIPLSTVDPADNTPLNGMQTFDSVETGAVGIKDRETEANDKGQEEEKVEADKSAADTSATPPSPASSERAEEASPLTPPEEPSAGEKTDDEGAASNKTSVESLKDPTNENNSNNSTTSTGAAASGLNLNTYFFDVPLNTPV